jgi:4-amino-4-deoxy-L-arabinose transferase-like glycosyltransferase
VYLANEPSLINLSGLVTPLFPLFLRIFGFDLLTQFLYVIIFVLILILVYKITLKISSKKIAQIAVLLVSLEPSIFISSLSLAPELLFSLALTSALYFGVCKPFKYEGLNYFFLSSLIGISVLIRPIALIAVICLMVFWALNYYRTSQSIFLFSAFITPAFALIWSVRNLLVHSIFSVSSISSSNLFWYEGVPALSEAQGISFEEAKNIEGALKAKVIGDSPSVFENYNYNSRRGLELILKYPFGWVESHIKGVGKVIFGVYKSKFKIIDEKVFGISDQALQSVHFIFLGLVTLFIWILFLNGISLFLRLDLLNAQITYLILLTILLPSTGQVAYARFRSPVVPLICIVAAIGVQNLINKYNGRVKWKK